MMDKCIKCKKELTRDEIGLHKRLMNRGDTEFMCKQCLAEYFSVSTELLDKKIEQFRDMGCTLFE